MTLQILLLLLRNQLAVRNGAPTRARLIGAKYEIRAPQ